MKALVELPPPRVRAALQAQHPVLTQHRGPCSWPPRSGSRELSLAPTASKPMPPPLPRDREAEPYHPAPRLPQVIVADHLHSQRQVGSHSENKGKQRCFSLGAAGQALRGKLTRHSTSSSARVGGFSARPGISDTQQLRAPEPTSNQQWILPQETEQPGGGSYRAVCSS